MTGRTGRRAVAARSGKARCGAALGWSLFAAGALAVAGLLTAATGLVLAPAAAVILAAAAMHPLSRMKRRLTGEPIVAPDFLLVGHAFRYPLLYFGFLGVRRRLAIAATAAAVLALPFALEALLVPPAWRPGPAGRIGLGAAAAALGALMALAPTLLRAARLARRCGYRFAAARDVARFGLLPTLAAYAFANADRGSARALAAASMARPRPAPPGGGAPGGLPDIVLVQAESFCDPARVLPALGAAAALPHVAALRREAVAHGVLRVPSIGGNSMRTEFAALSGLGTARAGVYALMPYQRLARRPVWTLARHLRAFGYDTLCIHPYHGGFFWRRDVAGPLGFDRFEDLAHLPPLARCGLFASDTALGDIIGERLRARPRRGGRPLFVFAITMEAHGPWPPGRVDAAALAAAGLDPPRLGAQALAQYLYHLRNTDRMLGALASQCREAATPTVLAVYGDHLPPLRPLSDGAPRPGDRTDYALWHSARPGTGTALDLPAHRLAAALTAAAGLPPYIA